MRWGASKLIWKRFITSPKVRVISITFVLFLLAASGFTVYKAFTTPAEIEREVPLLNYWQQGEFKDLPSSKPEKLSSVLFTELIDQVDMSFSYKFSPPSSVEEVAEKVEIKAIVENPGLWEKEVTLFPETLKKGDFEVHFPLEFEQISKTIRSIEDEIGIPGHSPDITIQAEVETEAVTDSGMISSFNL